MSACASSPKSLPTSTMSQVTWPASTWALIVAFDESSLSWNVTPVSAAYGSSPPLPCASWYAPPYEEKVRVVPSALGGLVQMSATGSVVGAAVSGAVDSGGAEV